jgi:hypothetical protein
MPGGWTEGQVMSFSGPTLTHGETTDGDLSLVIDFDSFTLDAADAGALHFVSRDLTVGGVDGTFDLKAGDVLVSFLQDETILAAYTNSGLDEAYQDHDLLVFRPDSFGDYSSGTFYLLLDDIVTDDLKGVTLIEQDTTIGGTDVAAGSFLIIQETSATTSVDLFVPTGVGAGTTTGSVTPLIDLGNLGIEANRLRGIEVIEAATTIGGQSLAAGSILATLNVDDNVSGVASNGLLVDLNDVFVLNLTSTGLGTTAGTATMFLDGSDIGLDDNPSQENPYALAIHNYSQLTVDTTSDVADGDTSSITALLLDKGADGKISLREAIAAANATPNRCHPLQHRHGPADDRPHVLPGSHHGCRDPGRHHPARLQRHAPDRAGWHLGDRGDCRPRPAQQRQHDPWLHRAQLPGRGHRDRRVDRLRSEQRHRRQLDRHRRDRNRPRQRRLRPHDHGRRREQSRRRQRHLGQFELGHRHP